MRHYFWIRASIDRSSLGCKIDGSHFELWKYRSMLSDRVQLPLPFEIICERERKAGATVGHALYAGILLTGGPTLDSYLTTDTSN
ncbi:hypothetical protein INT47_004955 [Mucor saturninus]|uniref:Uncharacterized protein n=1 Tax=Mucor saturninus TaxID=64648 RepID=A0A8H7R2P4_9FUNG|nr:hypothetical protein INT47_004955 [Mucor saturninus]